MDDALRCPECGTAMNIDAAALRATCPKCGAVRSVKPVGDEISARTRENLGAPPWALKLFLSGVAIMVLMFPVLKWWQGVIAPQTLRAPKQIEPPSKFAWDVTRRPLFRDLDGDGVDDLIARVRDDANNSMRIVAFNGATLKPIWATDSLGDWADALETVQLSLNGKALLLTDAHGGVELRDASSGALFKRFALPGVASQACAAPDAEAKFWVAAKEQGAFVEQTVPQPTPAKRPEWCPAPQPIGPSARVLPNSSAPKVPGFVASLVLNEGTDAMAIGKKEGTPAIVSFDPSRPGVRWIFSRADSGELLGAELIGGEVYLPLQTSKGRELLALDAAGNGSPKWTVEIPGQGAGTQPWERLFARGSHVFVPATTGLLVLDSKTGARVGLLGR